MAKPKIRFKGYTDEWEQRKLGDVSEKVCVGFVGTCEKFYTDETGIPMYRTGNLNGLSLNRDDMKYVTREFHQQNKKSQLKFGDILIARHGDNGKAVNYESTEEANSLNIVIIRPDFKKCNYRFLTDCINSPNCQKHIKSLSAGSTQAVINTREIEKLEVLLSESIDEQDKIASFLDSLDNLITLHQRKCEQTKKLKKYMLQKMFPQNSQKVPEIRFEGFTDDWEQRKVGELLEERNEQAPMSEAYPLMAFIANQGVAPKGERYDRSALVNDETGKKYKRTEFGDFIYSSNNLETGSIGLNKYGNACISPVYSIFKPTGKAELDFLGRRFLRKDFINEMVRWRQGVVYGQWKIHETDFMKIEVRIPSIDEQKKIGQYFDSLDHLITLHQQKCDELKNIKKFMFQNMFI